MGKIKKSKPSGNKKKTKKSFLDIQKLKRKEFQKQRSDKTVKAEDGKPRKAFKFENFSDKIASVDYSIVYQLAGTTNFTEASNILRSSVFRGALDHWRELNLTTEFTTVVRKLNPFVTLPQVIHGQQSIVEALKEGLLNSTPLSVQPVLELISGLATDLQQEFYPYLDAFISIITSNVMQVHDADIVKWSLRCISHLLKILWRPISGKLEEVYLNLSVLFQLNQPDYIRYLGAEVVAFLLRKSRQKTNFCEFIVSKMEEKTDPVAIAKLFFESVKTVNSQFNGSLEPSMHIFIKILSENNQEVLKNVFQFCCDHSSRESIQPLIDLTCDLITEKVKSSENNNVLLECLEIIVRTKAGHLITNLAKIVELFVLIVSENGASTEILSCIKSILTGEKISRTEDQSNRLVSMVFGKSFSTDQILDFVFMFQEYSIFEAHILKPYLGWVQDGISDNFEVISDHLTKILLARQPLCDVGSDLVLLKYSPIDLNLVPSLRKLKKSELFPNRCIQYIDSTCQIEKVRNAIIICSSVCPVTREKVLERTQHLMNRILDQGDVSRTSVLPLLMQTLCILSPKDKVQNLISIKKVVDLFSKEPTLDSVRSLSFALTCKSWQADQQLNESKMKTIVKQLVDLLSDPDSATRRLALHCLSAIIPTLGEQYTTPPEENYPSIQGLIEIMQQAENTPETLSDYKTKISLLQRLDAERLHRSIRSDVEFNCIPLRYLLGCLYTNFTLLWSPLQSIIASYGNSVKSEEFWNVFGAKLNLADRDVQNLLDSIKNRTPAKIVDRRVDYIKYRNQLWSIMVKFPVVAEMKNRDLVTLFLDSFLEKEYKMIRELGEDRDITAQNKQIITSTVGSLMSHLQVFSHFQDLKSLYRVAEMRSKVDEYLCHKVASVQKIALEILIAFKLKHLLPYKENLLRLLEDRDFKSELVAFPLGETNSDIKTEHRDQILPIILRLLYGRLRAVKRGKKDGGKGAVVARRTLILHHLLDVSEDHVRFFLDLIFGELFGGQDLDRVQNVYEYISENGEPPSKSVSQLQAAIEMIQAVIAKLGKLMDKNLDYILQCVVWLGFLLTAIDKKVPGYKTARNLAYSQLSVFFSKFPQHAYSEQAEEAIFKVFVWKPLENFENDYIHSPTGLLQLILCWSKTPKFRPYLKKTHPTQNTRILESIVKVLLKDATAVKVKDCVLEVFNNLVTPVNDDVISDINLSNENVGIDLALQEIDTLTSHFEQWILASSKDVKQLKKVGVKLDILLHLAPFISAPDTASKFVHQLYALIGSIKRPDPKVKVIVITQHLVRKLLSDEVVKVANLVLPLFGKLTTRQERVELATFMRTLAERNSSLGKISEICSDLTAFDRKRFDEPDFEVRMSQFIKIRGKVKEKYAFSLEELKAIFYICCHSLKNEADSSLKSNTLDTVLSMCESLQQFGERDPEGARKFITKICLEQIRVGIKHKDDMVRCDFISLLQKLVKSCKDCNSRVKDLSKLSSPDDLDMDFFENIRHVQLHRRGRVLSRLSTQLQENPKLLSESNLTQLIMPMCTTFLMNQNFVKHSQLVEQSINLLGAVCRALPWNQYEKYVKYYTALFSKESPHQKQLVKITTEILNAFHYSLDLEEEGISEKELELRKKIHFSVNDSLLPKLTNTLAGKTKGPVSLSDEDKLIQRVPLAVPIVRILQLNSAKILEAGTPSIISKTASFLKSKAIEIREAARSTLCSVMELLGPRFISYVLRELSSFLTRGYQVHVLTYTVHTMLNFMSEKGLLFSGDLDGSVAQLTELALSEMYGVTAEEKDVKKITGKLLEAKNTKSYDTMQLTAKYLSTSELMNLIRPFSNKLNTLSSFKNIVKIKECLRNIVIGLLANEELDPNFAMIFIFGVLTDHIKLGREKEEKKETKESAKPTKPDSYLIQKAPKRGGNVAKTAVSTTQHVIHEFGLNLLYFLLKRGSIESSNLDHQHRLEPFFPVLLQFLDSSHPTVITVSLRCFQWLVKIPLESNSGANVKDLTNRVFGLLKKYGAGTDGRGENYDLVVMASKLLVVLIRDVKLTQIEDSQLKVVFDYILVDVLDPLKQTTAFGLLTAVLGRKLISPDLHEVMLKLAEMSIQSNNPQVRQSARSAVITYMSNYDLKKKLGQLVDLYLAQLGYEIESGRLAAADAIKSIITSLGPRISSQAQFIFVSMAPHLLNDESQDCRQAISAAISALLKTSQDGPVNTLKNSVMSWFKGNNVAHVQLACRLLLIFIDAISIKVLKSELDMIKDKLPELFKENDSLCIQALSLLLRIVRSDSTASFWKSRSICLGIQNCMLHPHAWIRLLTSQLLGLYLTQLPDHPYLTWLQATDTLRSLILDSFEQLNLVNSVTEEISVQIIKNLIALTKIVIENQPENLSLKFLLKKAVKISNLELTSSANITIKRTLIFNYIAAVCLNASKDEIAMLLKMILPPLQREVSNSSGNTELKSHAQEVLDLLKSQLDDEVFSRNLMEVQLDISKKRGERSAMRKQTLILNPSVAAKRKISQNEAKKRAKKARRLKS